MKAKRPKNTTKKRAATDRPYSQSLPDSLHNHISRRAYEIFERRVRQGALDDWLKAERELQISEGSDKPIPTAILSSLENCPVPNNQWLLTYEVIVGAAASLLAAYPHYVGTRQYGHKRHYNAGILPKLLRKAFEQACQQRRPLDLYLDDLRDWTAGYFFNSGIVRIACAYEYTICTAKGGDPFANARFDDDCNWLKQKCPPKAVDKILDVIKLFKVGRKQLNEEVTRLVEQFHFDEESTAETIFGEQANVDDFTKTAVLFVWADYNWFKHRPVGYADQGKARERPSVQYALALAGYIALCNLYSWCYKQLS